MSMELLASGGTATVVFWLLVVYTVGIVVWAAYLAYRNWRDARLK